MAKRLDLPKLILKKDVFLEYFANLPATHFSEPENWSKSMEAQGWHGICASDHFWIGSSRYPHVFVTATRMACATDRIKITSSFCNNLFRSPVEFAQASLALQEASRGRFEAGLGAGWAEEEMIQAGMEYPKGPIRVSMYIEALQVTKSLLHTGHCEFTGEYYQVDIPADSGIGPLSDSPPLLIGSAGGPRSIRETTPLVDRIEIKASARATRGGHLDFAILATISEEEIKQNVQRVRKINADIPIGIFILVGAGENQAIKDIKMGLGDGFLGNFFGAADDVAEALRGLGSLGIDRIQLTELVPGSHTALAPILFSGDRV